MKYGSTWKRYVGAACAVAALGAGGCDDGGGGSADGGGDASGDGSSSAGEYRILFMPKASGNPVFRPAIDGAQLRAAELTEGTDATVQVDVVAPEATDAVMQGQLLAAELAKGDVDGIVISCSSTEEESLNTALSDARSQGIPVVAWDSDCGERDAFYSLDNYASGELAASLLAESIGDSGNVAILAGAAEEPNIKARVDGFAAEIEANHPDVTLVETVYCHPASEDHLCPPKLDQAMTDHEIDGWFFAAVWMRIMARGDTREGLPEKIPEATLWQQGAKDGSVKTVALDSLTEALPFVEDGRIQTLIGQKYWGWGYDTVGLVYEHLANDAELDGFIDSGTDLICEANVDEYSAAWASNDFSLELPACQ